MEIDDPHVKCNPSDESGGGNPPAPPPPQPDDTNSGNDGDGSSDNTANDSDDSNNENVSTGDEGDSGDGGDGSANPDCPIVNVPSRGDSEYRCAWLNQPDEENDGGGEAAPPPPDWPTIINEEFQTLPIPASTAHSWPDGWAVTQNDTAFWADAETRYLDFDLLSTPIQVKATPVKYEWDFGDGTSDTTSSPGTEPPSLEDAKFTHVYSETGTVGVTLHTVYNGMFSVNGGPWLMISGQARVPSETLELEVYRYHKYLVESDCLENPDGPDCKAPAS